MTDAITVVATGHANVRSLMNALERLGAEAVLSEDPEEIRSTGRLILPGVGAFGSVAERLEARGLMAALRERLAAGRTLLGICLGLQLLLEGSEESPGVPGLGWIPGIATRLQAPKVPHMGWNLVEPAGPDPVIGEKPFHAYFVHSYAAGPDMAAATTEYAGRRFASAVRKDNAVALQFHPERSGPAGLDLLRRYLRWA